MKKLEFFCLLLAISLIILQHFHYFSELYYDRDIAGYAYTASNILKGKGRYFVGEYQKPPGGMPIILAAFSLFGKSFKSIYLAALFFNLLSVFFIYLLAKRILSKATKLYFLLPVFFAFLFVSEPFRTYSANTEVFLAPLEIGGILLLGLGQYLLSGLLLGLGFLIRQTGIFTFVAGALFIIAIKTLDKMVFKTFIKNLLSFSFAFILFFILISIYFLYRGIFNEFLVLVFITNLRHLGEYLIDIRQKDFLFTGKIFWEGLNFEIILFGLFSLIGLFYTLIRKNKIRLMVSLWFIIICLGLSMSAIYPHHFIQLIAPLACISLLGISDTLEGIKILFKRRLYLRNISIAILIIILLIPYIRLITPFITKKRYRHYAYGAEDRFYAAKYIKEHTTPKDKIFVWDNLDAGAIILWSGRESITSYVISLLPGRSTFLPSNLREYWSPGPYLGENYRVRQRRHLLNLHQHQPKYIIIVPDYKVVIKGLGTIVPEIKSLTLEKNVFPEFFEFVDRYYYLETEIGICQIYRYKG